MGNIFVCSQFFFYPIFVFHFLLKIRYIFVTFIVFSDYYFFFMAFIHFPRFCLFVFDCNNKMVYWVYDYFFFHILFYFFFFSFCVCFLFSIFIINLSEEVIDFLCELKI